MAWSLSGLFTLFAEINQRLVVVTERLKPSPAFDVGEPTLQAGGLKAISRRLSAATPPVTVMNVIVDPGGITAIDRTGWHPSRGAIAA